MLIFDNQEQRNISQVVLEQFIFAIGLGRNLLTWNEKDLLNNANSFEKRKKTLETFFINILSNVSLATEWCWCSIDLLD